MTRELTELEYQETIGTNMTDVTETADPAVDIWPYVRFLVNEHAVSEQVVEETLVEKVYRDDTGTFDHIFLPTEKETVFIVIIVNIPEQLVIGHYILDLTEKYSL